MGRVLRLFGVLVATAFVAVLVWRSAGEMPSLNLGSPQVWFALSAGWAFYILSQLIAAVAWSITLKIYDVSLPRGRAESQLLISQIGKYLPGNVAQFLGRVAIARADGAGTAAVAGALLLEIGFVLAAAVLAFGMVVLAIPSFLVGVVEGLPGGAPRGWAALLAGALLTALAAVQLVLWHRAGRPKISATRILLPLALHLTNFLVLGLSLWAVTHAIVAGAGVGVAQCVAIFAAAWVAGFLMPGAPGGAGVRDGVIVIGLELFIAPGATLAVALAHRGASIFGDVAIFGLGLILRREGGMSSGQTGRGTACPGPAARFDRGTGNLRMESHGR